LNTNDKKLLTFSKDIPVYINIYKYDQPLRHWHQATELLFVLSGSADIIIADKSYHLITEDVCLINKNTIHETTGYNCTILSICFHIDELINVDTSKDLYYELNSSGQTSSKRYDYVRHLIAMLVKVNSSGENKYMTLSLLYALISHLTDSFQSVSPITITATSENHKRMANILHYIDQHYRDNLTLEEVARAHNMSVSYFASYFKKNTGSTFLNYYNNLRLTYAVNDMLTSDEPLDTIILNNGFCDTRSFRNLFKKVYNCLPSAYRSKYRKTRDYDNKINTSNKYSSLDYQLDSSNDLKYLAKYLDIYDNNSGFLLLKNNANLHIDGGIVDFSKKGIELSHNFRKLCCVGSAKQFLYSDVQDMVRRVQKNIGYEYVKFHGILSDEMMVYMEKEDGSPIYSFALVDKVIDFLLSVNLKPLIQLSFMPLLLASDKNKLIDMWHYNTSPPKDIKKWTDLVYAFVNHLIDRYGQKTIRTWLFCVWNEPDGSLDSFGWENPCEFYNFYKETYNTVKSIDNQLLFGTPSFLLIPDSENQWVNEFFNYCIKNECIPDFINIHYYDNSFTKNTDNVLEFWSISNIEKICPLNVDPLAFTKFINRLKIYLKKYKLNKLPIYLTEWNLTISQRDLINDTCFKSCYLTKNILENYDRLDSFGYWCITDFMEEFQLPNELYHGGLGMFTYNGISKAHYNTFVFLTHLRNELIAKGNGYFITKDKSKIAMILYNYEHYSKIFASGILFDMSDDNRYAPFTKMNKAQFQIKFENLTSTRCLIKETIVNQNQGSSYDAWAKLGRINFKRAEDYEIITQASQPGITIRYDEITNGQLHIMAELEPLEVRLIEIILDQ